MKLYRVISESVYNSGREVETYSTTTLYCGYDRLEAARVYYQHSPASRSPVPGNHGTRVRVQSKEIES